MTKTEYSFRACMRCEIHYIEDCPFIEVCIGGKNELPTACWREELVMKTQKPHGNE